MNNPLCFDIETGPLPLADIEHMMPEFKAPDNWKDPEKIEAKIQEQRVKWIADAALHANRGRVLAIGIREDGIDTIIDFQSEVELLATFWGIVAPKGDFLYEIIGHTSNKFDVPFMIRRSWKLGVPVPRATFNGRYLNSCFKDIADLWTCGDRGEYISLDCMAKFFGLQGKNGDGALFFELWEEDRDAAIAYLENDLFLTEQCARFMGVIN